MTNKTINFKQERDFGDIFNATFNFIGQEFKKLGTALLYFVVPVLILSAIASTMYSVKSQEMTQAITQAGDNDPFAVFSVMGSLAGYLGIMMLLMLLAFTLLGATVYCYILLYNQYGCDGFTLNDLWKEVMKNFWRVLVALLLSGIVIGVGFAFCVLPGVYLGVVLSILLCIMIFEGLGFSDAFSRSFKLMKSNWWFAFGVLIVSAIIVYILSLMVSLPGILMGFKSLFANIKKGSMDNMKFSTTFYVVNSIASLLSYLFGVITVVASAFLYFSIVEKIEKPSLVEKIEQMDQNA